MTQKRAVRHGGVGVGVSTVRPAAETRSRLADQLAATVRSAPGRLGVTVRADDGWRWSHDATRVVRAASTAKVVVLLGALRLVEQGRLDLAEPVRLPPAPDRVGGAGALALMPSVGTLPLVELLRLMVAVSDNDAANAVLDHAGLLGSDVLPSLLAEVPAPHTAVRRRFMDRAAGAVGRENETCAGDLAELLAELRAGRLLGPVATHTALELLGAQQTRDGLPAYLPPHVSAASKPGDLPGLRADAALLERGDRWVSVVVVADGLAEGGVDRGTAVLPAFALLGELAARLLDPPGSAALG